MKRFIVAVDAKSLDEAVIRMMVFTEVDVAKVLSENLESDELYMVFRDQNVAVTYLLLFPFSEKLESTKEGFTVILIRRYLEEDSEIVH